MQKIIYLSIINNMTSYNFGTGLDFTGSSSEAYPDVSELIAAVSNIQENIDTVLGIGDISVVVADVATAKSNITTQTGRVSVASNAIVALNVRTSNLEDNLVLLDNIVDNTNSDLLDLENSLVNYATLTTTQTLTNKTLSYNSNTFLNFPTTDLTPLQNSISDINNEILTNAADIVNLDLRLDTDEVTIQTNTNKIIANSNNISSNLQKISQNSNNIVTNSNNISTVSNNLASETLRINTAILNDIALDFKIEMTNSNVEILDTRLDVVEAASNTYLTSTNTKTVSNKTFDYNTNTFLNFPTGDGGGGATGDVTLAGTQTLTNKTMAFTNNTFTGFPTFDDSSIQTTLTTLDGRIDDNDTDVATLFNLTTINSNSIVSLSNNVTTTITSLSNNIATTITNLPFYNDTDIRSDLTAVEGRVDAVELDITSLDNRLDTVETAAPTLVTLTGTQTVTNKTFNYADNTFNGFPTGGGSGDVTLAGTQTLTNKTMAFANNTFTGFPTFDDSAIQTSLTSLDTRLDLAEDDITDTNNAVIAANAQITTNSNNIVIVSDKLVGVSNLVNTHTTQISTNTSDITTTNTNLTTLSNAYDTRINTNSTQISTNTVDISNRVIAPATHIANYIPQWNGTANSKTLVNGIDVSTIATLSGTQTLTGKTLDYNNNTFLNLPSGGEGGGTFTPSASNITVVNSNIPVSILNVNNPYKFRTYVSANYTLPIYQEILFNTKSYDLNNNVTNNRTYNVPITGYYDTQCIMRYQQSGNTNTETTLEFTINGAVYNQSSTYTTSATFISSLNYTDRVFLTAGDVIKMLGKNSVANFTVFAGSCWSMNLVNPSIASNIPIVSTTNINAYSYSGSGNIMTGQVNSNNYIPVWSSNNSTFLNNGIDLVSVTTLTGTQTLTNKTLDGASNTITNVSVLNFANPYKFRAIPSANLTIPSNAFTNLALGTESLDTNNNYNTTTFTYTVPITGQYQVNCMARWSSSTDLQRCILKILRGATDVLFSDISGSGTVCNQNVIVDILPCTVGDQLKCQVYQLAPTTPGNRTLEVVGTSWSMFLVCL